VSTTTQNPRAHSPSDPLAPSGDSARHAMFNAASRVLRYHADRAARQEPSGRRDDDPLVRVPGQTQ
jgi:hypothetical protein